jgi:hypothetical protein
MAQVLTNGVLSAAGAMKPGQGMKIAQLGMRMLAPPASPLRQGAPPAQLSTAGQNPQVAQFQQMFGVDYQTALAMMQSPTPWSSTDRGRSRSSAGNIIIAPASAQQNAFAQSDMALLLCGNTLVTSCGECSPL